MFTLRRRQNNVVRMARMLAQDNPNTLILPSRFTERWFAENLPNMTPGQRRSVATALKDRGWSAERINHTLTRYPL